MGRNWRVLKNYESHHNLKMHKASLGLTLIELIVVIIIVGVLATMAVSYMMGPKEQALTREANVNLKLIRSAEKIYRLEIGCYIDAADTSQINQRLKLSMPITNPNWNYKIDSPGANSFTAKAGRAPLNSPAWCIDQNPAVEEPVSCGW